MVSCVNSRIIDDLDLISVAGIDFVGDKIEMITIYNHFTPDKKVENKRLKVTIPKNEDLLEHLDREASKPVVFGDIEVLVLGAEAAKIGLFPIIDTLQRSADLGSRIYIVMTEDSVEDLLAGDYEFKGNGQYISRMIAHNIKYRDIPRTNLHLFTSDFFEKGKDAYLPILKRQGEDKLKISGLAIFDDAHFVHYISPDQMFYFKILVDKHIKSSMEVKVDNHHAVIENIKTKTTIKTDYDTLTVQVNYKMIGAISRYTGHKAERAIIDQITKQVEEKITRECLALLEEFQSVNIDPIGIERKFRQQNRDFDPKKWKDQYKHVTFKIEPNITIIQSGTVE
nr:Ger(x)C family spore germination protein [Bacillus sp. FJAT-50079]